MSFVFKNKDKLLIAGIILLACNLRSPITGVGSLISYIMNDLHLSGSISGLITTVPLIAFAVVSPFAGKLAIRFGIGKTLTVSLLILAAGIALRSAGGTPAFFCGTAVIGIGIAFGNVLLPSIVKSAFPSKVGVLTGVYTTSIALSAGLSSGVSIPIASGNPFGWRGALAVWLILAIAAILLWLHLWGYRVVSSSTQAPVRFSSMFKSPIAWNVAIYMGVQSLLFYSFVAWLPAILQSKGVSPDTAGYFASVYQWIGIPASFAIPMLAGRMKGQRLLAGVISGIYAAGLFLFLLEDSYFALLLGVLLCGFCTGACLSLSMCLMGLRTSSAAQTAALSGVSQSFGYALAAVSPDILGALYDRTASWTMPIIFLLAMTVVLFLSGIFAGRQRTISFAAEPAPSVNPEI